MLRGGSHVAGMEYLQEDRFEGGESEKEGTSESSFRLRVQRSTHTGKRHDALYCLRLIPGRDGSAEVRQLIMISITNSLHNTIKRMGYCLVMVGMVG